MTQTTSYRADLSLSNDHGKNQKTKDSTTKTSQEREQKLGSEGVVYMELNSLELMCLYKKKIEPQRATCAGQSGWLYSASHKRPILACTHCVANASHAERIGLAWGMVCSVI